MNYYGLIIEKYEKRIDRVELSRKKCKTAILLYCFHTAGVLSTFVLNNLLGSKTSFYRKKILKIILFSLNQFSDAICHAFPNLFQHQLYFTFPSSFQHKLYKKEEIVKGIILYYCDVLRQ